MQEDHKLCTIEEVSRLMDKEYDCYLEYRHNHLIVDILAIKDKEQIVVEIGFLSGALKRLQLLRRALRHISNLHLPHNIPFLFLEAS